MRHIVVLLPLLVACSSTVPGAAALDSGSSDSRSGDDGTGDAGADGAGACTSTSACVDAPRAGQTCVTTVEATMQDGTGAPLAGLTVFTCGTDLCTAPTKSAADGKVRIATCHNMSFPSLKVFSDPEWAPFTSLLAGGPAYTAGSVRVFALPSDGAVLPAGQGGDATSGGVTLTITASTTVKFDIEHTDANSQKFRAVRVTSLPPGLAGAVDDAWALAPLNTTLSPAAKLSVPNAKSWPEGTAVDFYLNGTDATTSTPPAPWGRWGKIGSGAVHGSSVVLDPSAGGLPEIAMVGLKKQ